MMTTLDLITYLFLIAVGAVWWRFWNEVNPAPNDSKDTGHYLATAGLMEAGIPLSPDAPPQHAVLGDALRDIAARGVYKNDVAFLTEAKTAYEAIVEGFASGHIDSISHLLTAGVREDFERHVLARQQRGETEELIFIGFRDAEIVDAAIEDELVWIEVRILADLVSATRDASGSVIAGDSIHVSQCAELWMFEQHMRQKRPVWLLSATDSDE